MSDSDYFRERAETEIALAQSATHESAVRAHCELAGYNLDRACGAHMEDVPLLKRRVR